MTKPSRSPRRWSMFQYLPGEILVTILDHLPAPSRAALVLSSRIMLSRLGVKSIGYECWFTNKWFYQYLKMDKDLQSIPEGCETKNTREVHPYLAGVVRFHIVKAVMDSHRSVFAMTGHQLPPLVLRHQRWLNISCPISQNYIIVDCEYEFCVVNGHLLLKTEKFVYPQAHGDAPKPMFFSKQAHGDAPRPRLFSIVGAVEEARMLFESDPALNYCCPQGKWVESWPTLYNLPTEYPTPKSFIDNFTPKAGRDCHTDISVRFVDLKWNTAATNGWVPRACYLTTWKDLGTGKSVLEQEWQSHFTAEKLPAFPTRHLRESFPTIHQSYEGSATPSQYRALSRFSVWSGEILGPYPSFLKPKSDDHQCGVLTIGGIEYHDCTKHDCTKLDVHHKRIS